MRMLFYKCLRAAIYAVSLLPLRALYFFGDAVLYPLVYHVAGYRRGVVRKNLANSFPEKPQAERLRIERGFYHSFCDNIVETLKLVSIPRGEMLRRMTFSGNDEMEKSLETHDFCFIYLGHFCNWEWLSTMPQWFKGWHEGKTVCGQLYHPVKNKFFDWFMFGMRKRFGAENIPKRDALRRILTLRSEGRKAIIGFIADQGPRWINIHEWVRFLNQDTPVYTGTERIAKKVNASVFFADVRRLRRGYYHCSLEKMTDDPCSYPGYTLTDEYMSRLEKMIRRDPCDWLWSHKRWKRRHSNEPAEVGQREKTRAKP